jgi:hypothetical protein
LERLGADKENVACEMEDAGGGGGSGGGGGAAAATHGAATAAAGWCPAPVTGPDTPHTSGAKQPYSSSSFCSDTSRALLDAVRANSRTAAELESLTRRNSATLDATVCATLRLAHSVCGGSDRSGAGSPVAGGGGLNGGGGASPADASSPCDDSYMRASTMPPTALGCGPCARPLLAVGSRGRALAAAGRTSSSGGGGASPPPRPVGGVAKAPWGAAAKTARPPAASGPAAQLQLMRALSSPSPAPLVAVAAAALAASASPRSTASAPGSAAAVPVPRWCSVERRSPGSCAAFEQHPMQQQPWQQHQHQQQQQHQSRPPQVVLPRTPTPPTAAAADDPITAALASLGGGGACCGAAASHDDDDDDPLDAALGAFSQLELLPLPTPSGASDGTAAGLAMAAAAAGAPATAAATAATTATVALAASPSSQAPPPTSAAAHCRAVAGSLGALRRVLAERRRQRDRRGRRPGWEAVEAEGERRLEAALRAAVGAFTASLRAATTEAVEGLAAYTEIASHGGCGDSADACCPPPARLSADGCSGGGGNDAPTCSAGAPPPSLAGAADEDGCWQQPLSFASAATAAAAAGPPPPPPSCAGAAASALSRDPAAAAVAADGHWLRATLAAGLSAPQARWLLRVRDGALARLDAVLAERQRLVARAAAAAAESAVAAAGGGGGRRPGAAGAHYLASSSALTLEGLRVARGLEACARDEGAAIAAAAELVFLGDASDAAAAALPPPQADERLRPEQAAGLVLDAAPVHADVLAFLATVHQLSTAGA